jgi:CRP-like cAMP-binding protein
LLKTFAGFTPAELDAVSGVLKPEHLAAGGVLFREGDKAAGCYVIADGRLRVSLERGGKPRQLAVLGRGELIGQMALLDGSRRSATCTAIEPSLVLRLNREELDMMFRSGAPFALKFIDSITRMLVAQLRFATRQLGSMSAQTASAQTASAQTASRPVPNERPGPRPRYSTEPAKPGKTNNLQRDLMKVAVGTLDCTVDGCGVDDVELVTPER